MRKRIIYIETGAESVCVYTPEGEFFSVGIKQAEDTKFAEKVAGLRRGFLPSEIVLVANTPRAIIRVEKLTESRKKLTPAAKWEMVSNTFPLGKTVNEGSHIFDGCVYTEGGKEVFFMAALPLELADSACRFGQKLLGGTRRLSRLETVEHVLFQRLYRQAKKEEGKRWVIFPQEDGLRILVLEDGFPHATRNLCTREDIKNGALQRILHADAPVHVSLLTRPDWGKQWFDERIWLVDVFGKNDVEVDTDKF